MMELFCLLCILYNFSVLHIENLACKGGYNAVFIICGEDKGHFHAAIQPPRVLGLFKEIIRA